MSTTASVVNSFATFAEQSQLAPRCAHKLLVLVNNCSSYFVAMAWLRAVFNIIGGFKPLSGDMQFSGRQIVWAWITTLLLTMAVMTVVKWLVREKIASAEKSEQSQTSISKISSLAWATAFDFAASAGTYAVMNSFAVTLLGCFDTSSSLRLWIWVLFTTLCCSSIILLGQNGHGPLSVVANITDDAQREQLMFLLTFNMGFVLAFVWEYALEKQFSWFLPQFNDYLWLRWVLCCAVLASCVLLLVFAHWVRVQRRINPHKGVLHVLPQSLASPIAAVHHTTAPLISSMPSFIAPVGQLSLQISLHALTLVGAVALNFTVLNSFLKIHSDKAAGVAWVAFSTFMSVLFVVGSAVLESLLIRQAVSLAVASGDTPGDAAHKIKKVAEEKRAEGSNGVMWYQQSVIRPMAESSVEQIMDSQAITPENKSKVVADFEMLDKYVECFNSAISFMAAFAWNNALSMWLVDKPAELAPPVSHAWLFAAVLSVIAPAVDIALMHAHNSITQQYGV